MGKLRQRDPYARDDAYLEYVSKIPCLVCTKDGYLRPGRSDPAHVKSRAAGGKDRGNTVPLCRYHHSQQHTLGIQSFEIRHNLYLKAEAERIEKAYIKPQEAF